MSLSPHPSGCLVAFYEEMHILWLKQRSELAESHPEDFGKDKMSAHAANAVKKFREVVRDLDVEQTQKLMSTVYRWASKN